MWSRVAIARTLAVGADCLQIGLFPLFFEGLASPLDVGLDVRMCGTMIWLVGWHIAFLPSFLIKSIPFADLAPTWTIAVWIATRKQSEPPKPTQQPVPPVLNKP